MLEIINVEKSFRKIKALEQVSIKIPEGEIFGIIGQNGAGKTTLLKIVAGLLKPDLGDVRLDGVDLSGSKDWYKMIGYVPDKYQMYDNLKVGEYLEFYAGLYCLDRKKTKRWIEEILSLVHLYDQKNLYVESLSQGMQQRLCVARALLCNPSVLVLDEPSNGLDPKARMEFREILRMLSGGKRTILISSHMVSGLPDYCTSMGILEKGKMILEGNMKEIMKEVKKNQPLMIEIFQGVENAVLVLKKNQWVRKISLDENTLTVLFEGSEKEEALLLKELVSGGVLIQKFYRETGDLESRFLDLIS
ncbi:MAG: ABC transporter ATP-binding protein [Lachnospiraceae bacterium]|nr:ABC transporter ATP-binding protein [Lachnospiraceae bacterium]